MKTFIASLILSGALIAPSLQAAGNAAEYDQASWQQKVAAFTTMTGRTFEYAVSGYRIRLRFDSETSIAWERLEAPDGSAGLKGTQVIDRQDLHPGIFLMAWTEPDGTHVVDVVDTQRMQLFANFVTAKGKRFQTHASMRELTVTN
ncbi:MAG: MoaF N-terminal domain-containing protein [Oceanospirillaceae bacterium]